MSPANRDEDIWGTGTESRNPFETDHGNAGAVRQDSPAYGSPSENGDSRQTGAFHTQQDGSWYTQQNGSSGEGQPGAGGFANSSDRERPRVNMSQGSWGDSRQDGWYQGGWQNGGARNDWQTGGMPGGFPQTPPPGRPAGSTAGKVVLVIGLIVRSLLALISVLSIIGFIFSIYIGYSYDDSSQAYSWSYEPGSDDDFDFNFGSSDPFGGTDYYSEADRKDALDDSELEDTSSVLSEEEAAEITDSAVLGLNTSTSKPATAGQWVKTKKMIDGEAYDVYIRVTDMAPVTDAEIESFNSSQSFLRLVPTANPDFVDMACTYEIYYPEGTPADRHQKDFYADIVSKQGSFEMKDGTVYNDEDLDDVFDITVDAPNSVTRAGELFTGRLTYTVTKDCSEYYIYWMDNDAGGRVYIRCTYEQGA